MILLSAHHSRYEKLKLDGMYVVSCGRSASSTIQVADEYYWCSNLKIETMLWHS